jgi:cell division protein FtsW (lipid II flippase)
MVSARRSRDSGPQLERGLLLLGGGVVVVGFLLTSLGMGQSWVRTVRIFLVPGAFLLAAFALDAIQSPRERLILPIVAMLCGMGICCLWLVDDWQMSKQLLWIALGAALMVGTYHMVPEPRRLGRYTYLCGGIAAALIVATMIWGRAATEDGPRLWLGLGPFSFQPAEAAKLLMSVFLAGLLAERSRAQLVAPGDGSRALPSIRYMGPVLLVVGLCLAMFVLQSDLGAAMLFFGLFLAMLYVGVGRLRYVLLSIALFVAGAGIAYRYSPKVAARVGIWLDPWSPTNYAGAGQIREGLLCFGEGGVFGTGLGLGMVKRLPAASTDLIFAVIGEQMGIIGCAAILLLYAMLVYRGFRIAWRAEDAFSTLLATALATVLAVQTLTIIGGVTRLIPLTGITLPFVSYGGSSMATNLIAIGLLLAISRQPGE